MGISEDEISKELNNVWVNDARESKKYKTCKICQG